MKEYRESAFQFSQDPSACPDSIGLTVIMIVLMQFLAGIIWVTGKGFVRAQLRAQMEFNRKQAAGQGADAGGEEDTDCWGPARGRTYRLLHAYMGVLERKLLVSLDNMMKNPANLQALPLPRLALAPLTPVAHCSAAGWNVPPAVSRPVPPPCNPPQLPCAPSLSCSSGPQYTFVALPAFWQLPSSF